MTTNSTTAEQRLKELGITGVGKVLSVNVGAVREFQYHGRPAKSGI
jgi:hypothetical protein